MSMPKFRVGICGGGIGGLCLAVALSKYPDIAVDVYEAAGRFKEIGAGVMIWSRTWQILTLLGMTDDFSKIAHAPPDGSLGIGFDYRKSDQPEEGSRFHLFTLPYGCIRFHRAHFLDVLVDHLPPGVAHFGKRLQAYSRAGPEGSVALEFADGSRAVCELLVGCDGIKSTVRQQMLAEKVQAGERLPPDLNEPVFTGTITYRGLVPVERLIRPDGSKHRTVESPTMYCGKNKHVVSYSITRGTIVNVVAMKSEPEKEGSKYEGPWVVDCTRDELLESYSGWEPEVMEMLERIERPTRWAIHHLRPLPFYVNDRVALLGDAAHAMSPHQGAGAGQAIEDAFILAQLLGHPSVTVAVMPAALKAYEQMYEFYGSYGDDLQRLGELIEHQWDWLHQSTAESAAHEAVMRLMEQIGSMDI